MYLFIKIISSNIIWRIGCMKKFNFWVIMLGFAVVGHILCITSTCNQSHVYKLS